jgi:hypothetical protein
MASSSGGCPTGRAASSPGPVTSMAVDGGAVYFLVATTIYVAR